MKKLVVKNKRGLFFNDSGYADPTAHSAIKEVMKDESEMEKAVGDLVHVIKCICELSGFEVVGRIHFRHKKTRKEFK